MTKPSEVREWTWFLIGDKRVRVDAEDYMFLSRFTWHIKQNRKSFYAHTNVRLGGKTTTIGMHRLILGLPSSQIDHIDRDGLNNSKDNLRFCTPQENSRNRVRHNPHGYRGVYKRNNSQFYSAQIMVGGKRRQRSGFKTPIEAARAYDELSKEHHGQFGIRNFKD